ncbi:polymorphic toxin-type HINT domain-containing protein [Rhodopirellula sp. MGV]|uniref:polymorphic toxin-type HINT domain-containing protein n=1 Tax=Rhodopirellula sp. MGV TaxID=2023130 RepID=UPI000B96EA48|nr:polymorphic toxin-type HINT domain-containing protein [Rhodopirellula sp. MGV]OYP38915.1 hypothetical protein CGZ80_01465 [Rhodopirellula sp. MGV]PNY37593.1 hypothetical protein C2E31_06430 [Rhodopirellula baltica]
MRSDVIFAARSGNDAKLRIATKPIEQLRVGDRVLARNPQRSQGEREACEEPNWSDWLKLSLVMPRADGSELHIELLRPESWVMNQIQFLVKESAAANSVSPFSLDVLRQFNSQVPLSPLRPLFRELVLSNASMLANNYELATLLVEMDLPELAIEGPAFVNDITPCISVAAGAGQVVTATFHHTSGEVIDLLVGDRGDSESIGTTSNHPIWSVDRKDYVQAGALKLGERVQTYAGQTKRVLNKLARPGPEPVFNLEVYGEHVYYVGKTGVLAHNSQGYPVDAPNPEAVSPRLTQRLEAFRAYRARGGTMDMPRWVKATQGNRAYGTGFRSGFRRWSKRNSQVQNHHLVSHPVVRELDAIGLDGLALRNRIDLQYQSAPGQHIGYQEWHRALDDEVVTFARNTPGLTEESFLRYLHRLYQRPDLRRRIPGVDLNF